MNIIKPKFNFLFNDTKVHIFHANKGDGLPKHEHNFPHVTMCQNGIIKITKHEFEVDMDRYTKPILLKENEWHEIEALEDGTIFINIFAG